MDPKSLENLAFIAPVLLFSMVAHEYAHGWAAYQQGDPTAYQLGRLTWNPLRHIDPFMTVILPLFLYFSGGFIFGGAKPVPVNSRNFRHFKRGDILVSLAGVATNFLLAFVCALLIVVLGGLGRVVPAIGETLAILQRMLVYGIQINLLLCAFNLMPIPPLDGSHVMKYLLPPAWSLRYQRAGAYGFGVLFLVLMFARPVIGYWMLPSALLARSLSGAVSSFIIASPWTS